MATTIDVSALTDAVNEDFGLLFANSMEHSDTLKPENIGALHVVADLKGNNLNIHKGTITANIIDASCSPTDATTDTYTDVSIPLRDLMFFKEWCLRDFENKPLNAMLPAGQNYEGLGDLERMIVAECYKLLGNGVEDRVWEGTDAATSFQGISTAITAGVLSTDGGNGAVDTAALTTANAHTKIKALVDAGMTNSNKNIAKACANGNASLWMGQDAAYKMVQEYESAIGATGNVRYEGNSIPEYFYGTNIRIRQVAGMYGTSDVHLTWDGNFAFGTDLLSDMTEFEFGEERKEGTIWVKAPFKGGAGVAVIADVLTHQGA